MNEPSFLKMIQSFPEKVRGIFGHSENTNLLKDRGNLAANQFLWWDFIEHKNDRFIKPSEVFKYLT